MTIRAKLLLLFFTLAAVPMLVVGAIAYYNSVRSVESAVARRAGELADEITPKLVAFFKDRSSEVRLLARNQPVQELYARSAAGAVTSVDEGMESFFTQFFSGQRRVYARTVYLDREGATILGYSRLQEHSPFTESYSFSIGEPTLSGLRLDDYEDGAGLHASSHYDRSNGAMLRLGQWVRDVGTGEEMGFLATDLLVDDILGDVELAQLTAPHTELILVSEDEMIVHHPQRHLRGTTLAEVDAALAQLHRNIASRADGSVWYGSGDGRRVVAYANIEAAGLTVLVVSDPRPLTAPVKRTASYNLALAIGAVVLMLILVPVVIGRITASIRKVTAGAEAIAAGDLDQEISVGSHDETRQLADSFNHMSRSLKTTMGDLRQLTEQLEERVQARTAELEQANEQIQQVNVQLQEASSHKSDFLARMSHDLRTPMNAIIGYTKILLRRTKGVVDERQFRNLENIQTSADNLLDLINDILDLSKIEAGRIDVHSQEVDLRPLVEECSSSVESLLKPGVSLVRELDGTVVITTDPDRLKRVLMNLLGNAVKFTEQGSITVGLQALDGGVQLSVADTGVGIAAEDLPKVFEEFHQLEQRPGEQQGSGLGLAIAQKTVELLGGTIGVASEVGRGTTFTVELPR